MSLPLSDVKIQDAFWSPRLQVNREQGIGLQYGHLKDVGALDALDFSRPVPPLPIPLSAHNHVTPVMWWDSDVAKWIEAASYSLETHPDPQLEALVDDAVARLAAAQQPDGYLNSYFTARAPELRFTNERDWHELYCAGHLIEAAVAHVQATGKRTLLEVVERYVKLISQVYGPNPGQKRGYPGHEEIELALMKLYRVTADPDHLALAEYFVNERGQQPSFFDQEARARGDDPASYAFGTNEYAQAHRPVREQREVVGHAVRAMYLYAGMADLAAVADDASLRAACEGLWQDLVTKRLYITGGLGPSKDNEGFTFDYDLPNDTAYAETCAAIALVFWAQRMLALTGDGRYADEMERSLYNNVLAGVSLDGRRYFYEQRAGIARRQAPLGLASMPLLPTEPVATAHIVRQLHLQPHRNRLVGRSVRRG
ncbi:glycoside hydrolase family 127 protein [Deinococcus sp. KNUC1210]|uniref:glycoside hydrolase family 127 protein n=1 Tax=Deinococcus sp. KNUC1210 TaxID=2917691 RepID=UPI00351D093D